MRIVTLLGMLTALTGGLGAIVTILRKFINPGILVGYSSMMAALLLIGGCIMLSLGMIGEYIGRIYLNINGIPQYVIRETCNLSDSKQEAVV